MNLSLLDWIIVLVPMAALLLVASWTRRHVRGVSDFMTGGRVAGRYLLAVSDGVAAMGLITAVAFFEFYYQSGFAVNHWQQIAAPIMLLVTLSGFVIYRFRETRAMTLAQFFEIRYSRRFRIFAGVVASIAGIVNYGLFPAVGAKFFVYYCGLPETLPWGGFAVPTFAVLMAVFLLIALWMVLFGGQITVMVTDCLQGIVSYSLYLVVAIAVLELFSWDQMTTALLDRPTGQSMLNPFDTADLADFNIWFILIGVFGSVYTLMAWQGNAGFNCAAASPHEARMGKILGAWRGGAVNVMVVLLAVAAYTFLNHPDFAAGAAEAKAGLDAIDNPAVRTQMQAPVAIAHFLPPGVTGAFLLVMLFLMVTTDNSYLHSWGSIVVQDVILPFRKTPLTPEAHLRMLRWSIVGVAVFAFFFSLLFNQTTYILMFFALTGSLYLGGAGSAIIGGLYWKRGTTAGAWGAMLVGAAVSVFGFTMEQIWPSLAAWRLAADPDNAWLREHAERFPINGQLMWGLSMALAIAVYIGLSLATSRKPFDMDRMLYRDRSARDAAAAATPRRPWWKQIMGIDGQFTRGDRALATFVAGWSVLMFLIWLVVTLWNVASPWPDRWWAGYFWVMGVGLTLVVGAITGVWFTIGGLRDLWRLFRALSTLERDAHDDGRVLAQVDAIVGPPDETADDPLIPTPRPAPDLAPQPVASPLPKCLLR